MVEVKGVEPLTSCLQGRRSSQLSYTPIWINQCTKKAHFRFIENPKGFPAPMRTDAEYLFAFFQNQPSFAMLILELRGIMNL